MLEKLDTDKNDTEKTLLLPRIPMQYYPKDITFSMTRQQFPIKLASVITFSTLTRSIISAIRFAFSKECLDP